MSRCKNFIASEVLYNGPVWNTEGQILLLCTSVCIWTDSTEVSAVNFTAIEIWPKRLELKITDLSSFHSAERSQNKMWQLLTVTKSHALWAGKPAVKPMQITE